MHTTYEAAMAAGREAGEASRIAAGRAFWGKADFEACADAAERLLNGGKPAPRLDFTPPRSRIARQFLQKRADRLAVLPAYERAKFLRSWIAAAPTLTVKASTDGPDAFDKALVVATLRTWLERVKAREGL